MFGGLERFMFRNVKVWFLIFVILVMSVGTILFGAIIVSHMSGSERFSGAGRIAVQVANAPRTVFQMFRGTLVTDNHQASARFGDQAGFSVVAEPPIQNYVLISRYDGDISASVVELVKEGDDDVLHRWVFDDAEVLSAASDSPFFEPPVQELSHTMRFLHPWLSDDGTLTLHTAAGALYQVNACGKPIWINSDFTYHHSLEPDADGNFWVPAYGKTIQGNPNWDNKFKNDLAVQISPDGDVLQSLSVLEIMETAGLMSLVYDYDLYQPDPFHLNDIQPVENDSAIAKTGDIYLSLGHLNLVMLVRPSTGELIWLSQDQIMHQHDIDIVSDDLITVFDNRRRTAASGQAIVLEANQMVTFQLPDTRASLLETAPLGFHNVSTASQGLSDLIPDSGLFVEETTEGRLLKFDNDGTLQWTYINRSAAGDVWTMNWSRYIPLSLAESALQSLRNNDCNDEE